MEVNEPALAYQKRQYTIEEYLELENAATEKHEYYQGEIFAMSGAKMPHNRIISNLHYRLSHQLSEKPCSPYTSDTRIHIEANTLFTYPDISVICREVITLNNDDLNVLNPTVLFEVLSPSTKAYDRGEKFKLYRETPTLKGYIMVDSLAVNVEAWHIDENGVWNLVEYKDEGHALKIPSIDVVLRLEDIYKGVNL